MTGEYTMSGIKAGSSFENVSWASLNFRIFSMIPSTSSIDENTEGPRLPEGWVILPALFTRAK